MTVQGYIDFLTNTRKSNPYMADKPLLVDQGGEVRGIGLGGGIFVTHDVKVEVNRESRLDTFKGILLIAGFESKKCIELANQYWPATYLLKRAQDPWWMIETQYGYITIGWRKRVISIEWDFADCIVTEDDVTKATNYVHAYKEEKAIEYLKNLRKHLDNLGKKGIN